MDAYKGLGSAPKGTLILRGFGRGFQFSFLGILILGMLSLGIVFLGMCILRRLVDGLNFWENFCSFPKIPLAVQHPMVVWRWFSGSSVTIGGGSMVARRWLAAAHGGGWRWTVTGGGWQ